MTKHCAAASARDKTDETTLLTQAATAQENGAADTNATATSNPATRRSSFCRCISIRRSMVTPSSAFRKNQQRKKELIMNKCQAIRSPCAHNFWRQGARDTARHGVCAYLAPFEFRRYAPPQDEVNPLMSKS
jgi:hypothetical protein